MLLLTSLVAFIAVNGGQTDASLLAKIVPTPTGHNGYEEYLRACDMVGHGGWNVYDQWIFYKRNHLNNSNTEAEVDIEAPEVPPGVSIDMSELAVRKVADDRLGGAYEVLRLGNLKKVWDPRQEFGPSVLYPEFASFKMLAKIGMNKAHVEFAEGRSKQAVEDLLEGMRFSKNLYQSTLISCLVGVAIQSIMLAEFNEHLGQLSYYDAQSIEKVSAEMIGESLSLGEVYKKELEAARGSLDQVINQPREFLGYEDKDGFAKAIQGLDSADRDKLKSVVANSLQIRFEDVTKRMSGDESGWLSSDGLDDPKPLAGDNSVSNLALVLLNEMNSKEGNRNVAKAMAKGRIQLHLLQLHAKVIEYHWLHNQWPANIEYFADAKSRLDPFTRQSFHYEIKDGGYRLYSTGVQSMGPIELKYHHVAQSQATTNEHP